jgi:predicted solute-binding protein
VETTEIEVLLLAARDRGVENLRDIALAEAALIGVDPELAHCYLRDNLHFTLGREEFQGLERFARLCAERGFVPEDAVRVLTQLTNHGCSQQ